jgi:hypothetical protein
MVLNGPEFWNVRESIGRELQNVSHDRQVRTDALQRRMRILAAQGLELMDFESPFFGCCPQRIGFRPRLLRRAEHGSDVIATLDESLQHRFPKILLANNCDFHVDLPAGFQWRVTFAQSAKVTS